MDTPPDANLSPAVVQVGDATVLLHDLFAFAAANQRQPATLRRDGQLSKADMVRLNEALLVREDLSRVHQENEAGWLAFVDFLARGIGLLLNRKGLLVTADGAGRWLSLPTLQQVTELWACWRDATTWDELGRVRSLRFVMTWEARYHQPAEARRRALAALATVLPLDPWTTFEGVVRAVRDRDPAFLRPRDPESWRLTDAATGRDLSPARYWDLVEGAVLRVLLTGPLHWLGLVSLGFPSARLCDGQAGGSRAGDAEGTLCFCALTPLGATLLDLGLGRPQVPWSAPAREPLVFQPNFEVVAPFHADLGVLLRLEPLTELVQAGPARVYRLTRDRFRAALDAGARPDDVLVFLEKASAGSLPQNVAYTLREWAAGYGRVSLEPATLLRSDDVPLMQELRSARRIAPLLDEALSPTVSVVAAENAPALAARLREDGYMPRVEVAADEQPPMGRLHLAEREAVPLLAAVYALLHLDEHRGTDATGGDLAAVAARLERRLSPAARAQAERQAREWWGLWRDESLRR